MVVLHRLLELAVLAFELLDAVFHCKGRLTLTLTVGPKRRELNEVQGRVSGTESVLVEVVLEGRRKESRS